MPINNDECQYLLWIPTTTSDDTVNLINYFCHFTLKIASEKSMFFIHRHHIMMPEIKNKIKKLLPPVLPFRRNAMYNTSSYNETLSKESMSGIWIWKHLKKIWDFKEECRGLLVKIINLYICIFFGCKNLWY